MKTEFKAEAFNPDGMNEGELVDWIKFLTDAANKRWRSGKTPIFGDYTLEQIKLARTYYRSKLEAMRYRRAGLIAEALRHEHNCNVIYRDIQYPLKW